jgi:hypothetical protein
MVLSNKCHASIMCKNKQIILLAVVALVAIIGLILMIKYSNTGMVYGGGWNYGRAVQVLGQERFFKAGNTPVAIGMGGRTRRFECTGLHPCDPESDLRPVTMGLYWSAYQFQREACEEPLCPDENPHIMCCPREFAHR